MYFKDFSIYLLVLPLFIGRVFLKARTIVLISDLFCLTFVCWCWCYIVIIFWNRCPFRHCILLAWFWVCFKNVTIRTSVTVQIEEVIVWIYGVIVWIEGVTVHIWVVIVQVGGLILQIRGVIVHFEEARVQIVGVT